jgi:hypothetical protein
MAMFFRVLVGLMGSLSVLTALPHWFRVDGLAIERGIHAIDAIGRANVRADVGGIFLGIGLLALLAAWTQSRTWTLATIILVASALLGRMISLALDGIGPRIAEPIIVEVAVLLILAGAWRAWKTVPEGL